MDEGFLYRWSYMLVAFAAGAQGHEAAIVASPIVIPYYIPYPVTPYCCYYFPPNLPHRSCHRATKVGTLVSLQFLWPLLKR